jgi:hypothetical protein
MKIPSTVQFVLSRSNMHERIRRKSVAQHRQLYDIVTQTTVSHAKSAIAAGIWMMSVLARLHITFDSIKRYSQYAVFKQEK